MSEAGWGHGPTRQANLAHVARHLDRGKFTADDARALAGAIDDVRSLQSRIQDALKALAGPRRVEHDGGTDDATHGKLAEAGRKAQRASKGEWEETLPGAERDLAVREIDHLVRNGIPELAECAARGETS